MRTRLPRTAFTCCWNLAARAAFAIAAIAATHTVGWANDGMEYFEKQVRPILVARCYACHSGSKSSGGLSLESRRGWEQGGDTGPAVVPGDPAQSLLVRAVQRVEVGLEMPPESAGGKLPDAEIAILSQWVSMGAPDPRIPERKIAGMNAEEAANWWAFQPLVAADLPPVVAGVNRDVHNGIDQFLLAKMDATGITPLPLADRRTLIRRATYDLTGLPPSAAEVNEFVADTDPAAFRKLVDRLLDRPAYGEAWGRHWLDVVRYADSLDARGYGSQSDISEAWRYRDWVVNALNSDMPYSDFVRDQVAGDLLAATGPTFRPDQLVATGVYAIGSWGNGDADKQKIHADIVDDQVDLTSRAFLGITLSCARCHDHKFDPLTTRDYYAMAGFFFSSRILDQFTPPGAGEIPMRSMLLSPSALAEYNEKVARITEIDSQLKQKLVLLDRVEHNSGNIEGFFVRRGPIDDTPCLTANLTSSELSVLTFRLPPRSVALHPGPTAPITVLWTSPASTEASLKVKLIDADPVCGDGIVWELKRGAELIGSGVIENGGQAEFQSKVLSVSEGDRIRLVIQPRGNHACDTTTAEFVITATDQTQWNFTDATQASPSSQGPVWKVCQGDGDGFGDTDANPELLTAERTKLKGETSVLPQAHGLRDGGIPRTIWEGVHDARIHKRGRYDQLGDEVPRGFPQIISGQAPPNLEGSGRRELAEWLTSPGNPLTARVIVNRVWQHHFGHGLVRTPNNFGKLGERPDQPELLDWLAVQLIDSGWSLKALHRLIMSSAAYQRMAGEQPADPENRLVSHQHRRRLSAEETRDSLLAAAGQLDLKLGGPPVREINLPRRTLYLATIRSEKTNFQNLFDGASPEMIVESRNESVVAPQALWLLNNEFAMEQSLLVAQKVAAEPGDLTAQTNWLIARLFQRPATNDEVSIATQAVANPQSAADWEVYCQLLFCLNEFVYVD